MAEENKKPIPVQATENEWATIDLRAANANKSRSEFMLACAQVPDELADDQLRLNNSEHREMYYLIQDIARTQQELLPSLKKGEAGKKRGVTINDPLELREVIDAILDKLKWLDETDTVTDMTLFRSSVSLTASEWKMVQDKAVVAKNKSASRWLVERSCSVNPALIEDPDFPRGIEAEEERQLFENVKSIASGMESLGSEPIDEDGQTIVMRNMIQRIFEFLNQKEREWLKSEKNDGDEDWIEPSDEDIEWEELDKDEITEQVKESFKKQWTIESAKKVPKPYEVHVGNKGEFLNATCLCAKIVNSEDLSNNYKPEFVAEIYKNFFYCASKIIRYREGSIVCVDGNSILGVFLGDSKNSNAASCALQCSHAVNEIITPALTELYPKGDPVEFRYGVGIDSGRLLVTRNGIPGADDYHWIGSAIDYAVKLCDLSEDYNTLWITQAVYDNLSDDTKYGGNPRENMWEERSWTDVKKTIYRSAWQKGI
jgi:class 3 adenylate cyclase/uncharacterized protein (DUF1778 family)